MQFDRNKIAIIIPYYKIDFFEETLKSVAAQTNKNFTLYIGNDASPNDPMPLISKYFEKEEYQYFNYKDNVGGKNLALQWQRILKNVTEDWFQILGDDDTISENFAEEFYNNLKEVQSFNCNVIKTSQCLINEEGKIISSFTEFPKSFTRYFNWHRKFVIGERASLSEHILKTEKYHKYGFQDFPIAWGSDDVAVFDFSENSPIYFINTAKVFVRFSEKSISGSNTNDLLKKRGYYYLQKYMLQKHFKNLKQKDVYNIINQQVSYAYKYKLPLNLNLFLMYWYYKDLKKIRESFKTYYYLMQNKFRK